MNGFQKLPGININKIYEYNIKMGDKMEPGQFIMMIFLPIAMLVAGIHIYEKNYMFGIDNYVYKLSIKHNIEIDKATYCRFEGMQRIKTGTSLLVLEAICFLFGIKYLNIMIKIIFIWGIIDIIFYYKNRNKLIKNLNLKNM